MNTGEATDTFAFTVTGLPAGWTATTETQTLTAGQGSTANVNHHRPGQRRDRRLHRYRQGHQHDRRHDHNLVLVHRASRPAPDIDHLHRRDERAVGPASRLQRAAERCHRFVRDRRRRVRDVPACRTASTRLTANAISNASGVASANPILLPFPGSYTLTISIAAARQARRGQHERLLHDREAPDEYRLLRRPDGGVLRPRQLARDTHRWAE